MNDIQKARQDLLDTIKQDINPEIKDLLLIYVTLCDDLISKNIKINKEEILNLINQAISLTKRVN